jgi:nucleotide-binding universal stress UspA family protein
MFSRILVATDLSEASDRAICALAGLQALGSREAILVHCLKIPGGATLAQTIKERMQHSIQEEQKTLEELGFRTTFEVVVGLPGTEINRIAADKECSLIVVGSHGQTMAGEILLGSVASAVIQSATRPVLVIRLRIHQENGHPVCDPATCNPLQHVLFPTDFSDNAERAFSYVEKIAGAGAKRITLLHVQDSTKIEKHLKGRLKEFNAIDTARLDRMKRQLEEKGAEDVRIELPYGLPAKEILHQLQSGDVSLVVMGSQGRGYFSEVFLGSVSHRVARHSQVPILLIPTPR